MSVKSFMKIYGFLEHPSFPEGVFMHYSACSQPMEFTTGDRLEVCVSVKLDEKRNEWGYAATDVKIVEIVARQPKSMQPHEAWASLISVLDNRASGKTNDASFQKSIQQIESTGPNLKWLFEWTFDEVLATNLRMLRSTVDKLIAAHDAGQSERLQRIRALHLKFKLEHAGHPWPELLDLAEVYLRHRGIQVPSAGEQIAVPSISSQAIKKTTVPARKTRARRKRSKNAVGSSRKRALEELKRYSLAVPSASSFAKDATAISVYIDEAWPAANDPEKDKKTGVIAGIVWEGDRVDENVLKRIRTHGRGSRDAVEAIQKLLECERALPFIMPIQLPHDLAQRHYFELLEAGIKVLLGWLLPQHGRECSVRILIEHYRKPDYWNGTDKTEYFQGVFSEARLANRARFNRWRLRSVCWYDKNEEYIPYADCIAYLALEHTESNRLLGELANYKNWPGYLRLSLNLLPRLSRLDYLESVGNVDDLLDFILETHGTELCRVVLNDFRTRLSGRKDLLQKLMEALEERYKAKVRDLRSLRRLFNAVHVLVSSCGEEASARLRLLWTLLTLQSANHDGDPERAHEAALHYRALREEVLPHDRELVAHADLNLAVHLNDQFMFEDAWIINDDLVSNPGFPFLPPLMRGVALSSLGQSLSITGQYRQADDSFQEAIRVLRQADPGEYDIESEVEQTRIYRAINAQDGSFDNAAKQACDVLRDFRQAIDHLAEDGTIRSQYRHHLLVRSLWMLNDMDPWIDLYLSHRSNWQTGDQHPWELIAMYRALLLWDRGSEEFQQHTEKWFDVALEICRSASHGATVQLIGAMIAAVASCCMDDPDLIQIGRGLLNNVQPKLPHASGAGARLHTILEAPSPLCIQEALSILPFNYH